MKDKDTVLLEEAYSQIGDEKKEVRNKKQFPNTIKADEILDQVRQMLNDFKKEMNISSTSEELKEKINLQIEKVISKIDEKHAGRAHKEDPGWEDVAKGKKEEEAIAKKEEKDKKPSSNKMSSWKQRRGFRKKK